MTIREMLSELREEDYAAFQAKLIPTVPPESLIGVRMPALRELAKRPAVREAAPEFTKELPHRYYEENMLHAVLLSGVRDFEACLQGVEAFLPYIDNWAVCDSLIPKVFAKHRDALLPAVKRWIASPETYVRRFGIGTLMRFYLDDAFRPEYLALPAAARSGEYYVNMMTAWYFATALAKQWEATVPYLEERRLDPWVHNKTIQKARESFRVPAERKAYLQTLRR